jgi:hypothetical protein
MWWEREIGGIDPENHQPSIRLLYLSWQFSCLVVNMHITKPLPIAKPLFSFVRTTSYVIKLPNVSYGQPVALTLDSQMATYFGVKLACVSATAMARLGHF